MKGILSIHEFATEQILQVVRELYDFTDGPVWKDEEERYCRLVFIGENLDINQLESSFIKHCQIQYPSISIKGNLP